MTGEPDLASAAREIIDANRYMVVGTSDSAGTPWASPVYFATASYREFFWVSRPEARHSANIEARSEVSIVIFDSTAPISTGGGVYMSAAAEQLSGEPLQGAIDVFSRRSESHGGRPWGPADVEGSAHLRLYRATAIDQYILDDRDQRVPISL